jgi:threonine synthase
VQIPEMITALFDKEAVQNTIIDKEKIEEEILSFV